MYAISILSQSLSLSSLSLSSSLPLCVHCDIEAMGEEVKQDPPKAEEAKPEEKEEEVKPEEPPKPPEPFVLFVDLHCVGCARKIEKSIMRIRGVEGVAINMVRNQVTIKGIIEPQAICNKIMKKTKRKAKVISPVPAAEGEPIPELVASQVSELTTVELNVNMHCEACAQQLKRKILKMKGVRTVETELSSSKVTVTGTMDGDKLVEYVYRRTKKAAKIVPQPEPEKPKEEPKPEDVAAPPPPPPPEKPAEEEPKPEEKKEEGGGDKPPKEEKKEGGGDKAAEEVMNICDEQSMQRMVYSYYQPLYMIEKIPPPQLFSDENPNACSIS